VNSTLHHTGKQSVRTSAKAAFAKSIARGSSGDMPIRTSGSSFVAPTKITHLPLEANASKIVRGICEWDSVGHIHLFSIETAIKTVEYTANIGKLLLK
jgi:hypothetical protein